MNTHPRIELSTTTWMAIIMAMMAATYMLVHATGGIKYGYSHSMYLPILLAGFLFGPAPGMAAGLLGGIILGPAMPMDVATGEAQELSNWLYRTLFFTLVGGINGLASSQLRADLKRIEWLLHHDLHSGLPNKTRLLKALDTMPERDGAHNFQPQLVVMGAHNMSDLTSTFGITVVDSVMREMYQRLASLPTPHNIFHYHPERLALVCLPANDSAFTSLIQKCLHLIQSPVHHEGIPLHLEVTIGWTARIPEETTEMTLRKAEMAMEHARAGGLRQAGYTPDFDQQSQKTLRLLGMFNDAMQQDQLCLHYQPKINLANGQNSGLEALIRWQHPEEGMMPPALFLAQVEQSSLIHDLTCWVMDHALAQFASWKQEHNAASIAINISARNLLDPGFSSTVCQLVKKHNIDPALVELEITESALMQNPESALKLLHTLADSHFNISIDDFGTGYSSLQYLSRLPASTIKIDQSFVRAIDEDSGARHIIDAAIQLAHSLGIKTVGEGIETETQLRHLQRAGCDIGQGYLISKPLAVDKMGAWLAGQMLTATE